MDPLPPINPILSKVPETVPPVITPEPAPVAPPKPQKSLIVGAVLAIFLVIAVVAYYFLVYTKQAGNPRTTNGGTSFKTPKGWINCEDKRQVIEEGNLLYVGCLGGVLVLDKNTGEVKDQISVADGLGNALANSLVKKGDVLYIGTQDGFTIFNLKTRTAQKMSVKEGLVNGSNVKLAEDDTNIWVSTFDGVSLFDTVKGTLANYKNKELDPEANKVNIVDLLVTDKYVYFLEVASVESSGAVIRFDKSAGNFKTFKPSDFARTGPYARLDINTIAQAGGQVFVSDGNELFSIEEITDAVWKNVVFPRKFILNDLATDSTSTNIIKTQVTDAVLIFSGNKLYKYTVSTGITEVFYDFGKDSPNIIYSADGGTLWFSLYNKTGSFVSSMNLTTKQISNYLLKNRPQAFGNVVALIDEEPVVDTGEGIFKYALSDGKFTPVLAGLSGYNGNFQQPVFQPIPGTPNVFIFRQVCGQGCEKPSFDLYDYAEGTGKELLLPASITKLIESNGFGGVMSPELTFSFRDFANGKIGLSYTENGIEKYIVYDVSTGEWSMATKVPAGADKFDPATRVACNRVYTFKDAGKFNDDGCTGLATNGTLSWKIVENKIIETDIESGKTKTLTPPTLEADYSPFDSVSLPGFGRLVFAEGKLWIGSDRGLISYDPQSGSYKLYGPTEGLLSKNVVDYLIGKNIWVVTGWGGLSAINK